MAKKMLISLDLCDNELQNAVLHPLATAPATTKTGKIYYNSSDGKIYIYNGSAWMVVGAVTSVNNKTGVVALTQDDIDDGTTYKQTHNDLTDALVTLINGALQKSGGTMSGNIAMGGHKITGLADGTSGNDAVTKSQLDAAKLGALKPSGSVSFENLPAASIFTLNNIYNVTNAFTTTSDFVEGSGKSYPAGTNVAVIKTGSDAAPVYKYDTYTGVIDLSPYLKKDGTVAMTGPLAMGSNKITGLASPASDNDAATKKYVDDSVSANIKTATGTIGTSATSATVSYSGTLINAYATQGGSVVQLDIAPGSGSVVFTVAQTPASAVTCVVVYA